jgi:glycine oxidase
VVIGAGVIGLASAWRLAQRGVRVAVVDPRPGRGASHAAAGMLAPVTEVHYGEEALLRLNLEAARRYPVFVGELEEQAGQSVGYRPCGTVAVAADNDDRRALADLFRFQRELGLEVSELTSRECRRLEPALSPSIRGGLRVEGDHQVDPRALVRALLRACSLAKVVVHASRAAAVEVGRDRVRAVVLADGERVETDWAVLAAGAWSPAVAGLPPDTMPPIRPVKGQIIRLGQRAGPPLLNGNVRALVEGASVYLVPRLDGEIVVGATVEEQGFDTTVTAGAVLDLLRDARLVLPDLGEAELVEASAGLRPCCPDNAPVVGATQLAGLVLASGHYRNGILLAPVTAEAVADQITTGALPAAMSPFAPGRFEGLAA